jgi:hypothetical protein
MPIYLVMLQIKGHRRRLGQVQAIAEYSAALFSRTFGKAGDPMPRRPFGDDE